MSCPSDIDDLDMRWSDFVDVLKMLIFSENTLFRDLTMAIPNK